MKEMDTINLKSLATAMTQTAMLEHQLLGREDTNFIGQSKHIGLGLFRLVIMGEIKKGKSSFINSLLGEADLLPVHDNVTTSTIYKIRYGTERKYTVYFKNELENAKLRKKEIPLSELTDYGTEAGNPRNNKQVDFIAVEAPSPLLRSGLVIVDTPGVGGLYKEHRDITWKHAPKADGIFFVTDSVESPIGGDEVEFLKELIKITSLVYFVQTKGDQADSSEARKKRMLNNIDILGSKAGLSPKKISYFIVSSELKKQADSSQDLEDLHDSGYLPVIDFLVDELKVRKNRNLALLGMERTRAKVHAIEDELLYREKVASANTKGEQDKIRTDLDQADNELQDWNTNRRAELLKDFSLQLHGVQTEISSSVNLELRPMGNIANTIKEKMEMLTTADDIYSRQRQLLNKMRSTASEKISKIGVRLETEVFSIMNQLSERMSQESSLSNPSIPRLDFSAKFESNGISTTELCNPTEFFTEARATIYGGLFGVTAATVFGGVIGSVVPIAGTMIGSMAGMAIAAAWGGYKGYEHQASMDKQKAVAEMWGVINQELGNMQIIAQGELSKAFQRIQTETNDQFRNAIAETSKRIVQRKEGLVKKASESAGEQKKHAEALKLARTSFDQIRKQLKAMDLVLN